MKQTYKKSEKFLSVSRAILETIEKEGTAKISHSRIARLSKVSRAWIYEYMGKSKEDLLDIASEIFASHFTKTGIYAEGVAPKDLKSLLEKGQDIAFQKIKEAPVIIKLYFRFRGTSTPMGVAIKKYEKHWLDFISENLVTIMGLSPKDALTASNAILVLRLGYFHRIATSSDPTKEIQEAKEGLDLLYRQVCRQ